MGKITAVYVQPGAYTRISIEAGARGLSIYVEKGNWTGSVRH
jgi:hypothetical protein